MARLTLVAIRRFKRIEQIEIPLDDVTLLIGANNSGKSSILQAIHFAVSIAQTARLVGEGVAWRQDTFELSFNPSQLLYSPVADVLSLATGGTLLEPRASQIEIELKAEGGASTIVGLRRGRNRNIAVSIAGRSIGEQLMDLPQPFTVYAPGLAGVPKEERFMSPGVVRRIVARGDANLTLRNVLRMLNDDPPAWSDL
jgi:ABC-type cobalamin/Fe3+-siderophores transport system ATPase subunit